MAIIRTVSTFELEPPSPNSLCKKMEEICGIPVLFIRDEEPISEFRALSGKLKFDFESEGPPLEIYSYIPGAIKALEEEIENQTGYASQIKCEGYDDCLGSQRIYLKSYLGQEMTLHNVASLALLQLGGVIDGDLKYLEDFSAEVTAEDVKERIYQNEIFHRKRRPFYVMYFLFCICMAPLYFIWSLITMPYHILNIYRRHPEIFNQEKGLSRRGTQRR